MAEEMCCGRLENVDEGDGRVGKDKAKREKGKREAVGGRRSSE